MRFGQELLELPVGLDDLNSLVLSHQDVLLETDLLGKLTDLFHCAALSSVPIGRGIGSSVIFDVQLLNVLRKLRAASSEEKPSGLQIDDVSGLVHHYFAKFAEHVDLILGQSMEERQLFDVNDDVPVSKYLPKLGQLLFVLYQNVL